MDVHKQLKSNRVLNSVVNCNDDDVKKYNFEISINIII